MPYKTFQNWLFDKKPNSPIPHGEDIPDILKYNSPITHTYIMSLFILNGKLNHFLDSYMNNIGLRYIEKEELFKFAKQCVRDFKVKKNSIPFIPWKRNTTLFNKLRAKFPLLKNHDVELLCKVVENHDNKDAIYSSLSIDKPKKKKLKKKAPQKKKMNLKQFLAQNFATTEV